MHSTEGNEEALKHLRNALELELDRKYLQETITRQRERMRTINQAIRDEKSAIAKERPSGYSWRKVVLAAVNDGTKPVAYR
ncbi:hypothetical protein JXL21_08915 [Candidatus Bathyarchaeota archaeon]|nr:hypothetical protein [Candidatus Bathyarchaeota archaeon]